MITVNNTELSWLSTRFTSYQLEKTFVSVLHYFTSSVISTTKMFLPWKESHVKEKGADSPH